MLLPETVTADISVEVPNTSADPIYDGVPPINTIDFGFYAVPMCADITGFIMSVDNELFAPHYHTDISGYISSEVYLSSHLPKLRPDPYSEESSSMLSVYDEPLRTSGDYYERVNEQCSLYPYKDPIYWRINPLSKNDFPDNVEIARN